MMRELKFRARDKSLKKIIVTGFYIIGEVTVFDLLKKYKLENLSELLIEQFTGKKDKNDVELYEGDIYKEIVIPGIEEYIHHIEDIRTDTPYLDSDYPLQSFEKLGDIHNNPELLTMEGIE